MGGIAARETPFLGANAAAEFGAINASDASASGAKRYGDGDGGDAFAEALKTLVRLRRIPVDFVQARFHPPSSRRRFLEDYQWTEDPPKVVGRGFSGCVRLCERRGKVSPGGPFCAKVLDMTDPRIQETVAAESLRAEAALHLTFDHPHIVRLVDVYVSSERIDMVLEHCSGGNLLERLEACGASSESEAAAAALQMLAAVRYLHGISVVHRDIKLSNWVVSERDAERLKLIDFGFSFVLEAGCKQTECMGTLGYLAPELVQCTRRDTDGCTEKCDIWSLGVCVFHLLAGAPPFNAADCDGYSELVLMEHVVHGEYDEDLMAKLPEDAAAFVKSLLVVEHSIRPSAELCLRHPWLARPLQERLRRPARGGAGAAKLLRGHITTTSCTAATGAATRSTQRPLDELASAEAAGAGDWFVFCDRGLRGFVSEADFLQAAAACGLGAGGASRAWAALGGRPLSYSQFLAAFIAGLSCQVAEPGRPRDSRTPDAAPLCRPRLGEPWQTAHRAAMPTTEAREA